jgi:hypothetical protein
MAEGLIDSVVTPPNFDMRSVSAATTTPPSRHVHDRCRRRLRDLGTGRTGELYRLRDDTTDRLHGWAGPDRHHHDIPRCDIGGVRRCPPRSNGLIDGPRGGTHQRLMETICGGVQIGVSPEHQHGSR